MMSFDHLLNRPAEEVAYSHPAGSILSPSSPGQPSATSPAARAHKYSNSGASTASFASSSGTHPFSSHSRNSSYSTSPETPPADSFSPDNFRIASNDGSDKMADIIEAVDVVGKFDGADARVSRRAYPFGNNRAIDMSEEDDRAESPTDAVMPMMRRAAADSSSTSSPLTYSRAPAALEAMADPAPTEDRTASASDSGESGAMSAPASGQSGAMSAPISGPSGAMVPANAPIFPASAGYNPNGTRQLLRLSQELINMVVPRSKATLAQLMDELDFTTKRVCKYMEGVCHMTVNVDVDKINWRKAMSHVFGRNKNCTRSIPEQVWLWTCRKHYQRGRYRNSHDYAKKQVWSVTVQVLRLEVWSNYNQDMGVPQDGVVVDWTLEIRRREQLRLEDASRKRKMTDEVDEEDDGEDESGSPVTPDSGLVPQWLLNQRGSGKSTVEILEILNRIRHDLDNATITNFPDIEILPNITGERAKPKTTRAKPRNPPAPRKSLPQRAKRQRVVDEEDDHDVGNHGGRHHGSAIGRFGDPQRYDYGNPSTPSQGAWATPHQDSARAHMRARSLDVGSYNQQPMAFQGGAPAGYPPPPNGYAGYHQHAGYNQSLAPSREYMRPDNAYQNGYWDPGYDARQRQQLAQHQQVQQQQATYPHGAYYQSSAAAGAPQGGPPTVSTAKHSRNLSTPVRSTSMMMGGRPHEAYGAPHMAPRDGLAQDGYGTPQMPHREGLVRSHESAATYPQHSTRFQTYSGLPVPTATAPSDNIPRAAEYGTPLPIRHAGHGAAPPTDGYEPYPPVLRRQ